MWQEVKVVVEVVEVVVGGGLEMEVVVGVVVVCVGSIVHLHMGLMRACMSTRRPKEKQLRPKLPIAPTAKWWPARPVGRVLFTQRVVGSTRPGPACTTKVTVLAALTEACQ